MQRLRFLSRLAFLGNIAFLLSVGLQFIRPLPQSSFQSTLVVLGYALGPLLFSPLVNGWYLVLLLGKKGPLPHVPAWLVWSNAVTFLIQILFFILLFQ